MISSVRIAFTCFVALAFCASFTTAGDDFNQVGAIGFMPKRFRGAASEPGVGDEEKSAEAALESLGSILDRGLLWLILIPMMAPFGMVVAQWYLPKRLGGIDDEIDIEGGPVIRNNAASTMKKRTTAAAATPATALPTLHY